jgi:hypothetical protein
MAAVIERRALWTESGRCIHTGCTPSMQCLGTTDSLPGSTSGVRGDAGGNSAAEEEVGEDGSQPAVQIVPT